MMLMRDRSPPWGYLVCTGMTLTRWVPFAASCMAAMALGLLFSMTTMPSALGNSRRISSIPATISFDLVCIS